MNAIVKKISITLLSFMVLFSSMSFAIEKHYCGDMLMDVSYFGSADNCGVEEVIVNSSISVLKKNNCCKDQATLLEIINLQNVDAEVLFFKEYLNLAIHKNFSLELKYYTNFFPPDLEKDIQVLHQAFLI